MNISNNGRRTSDLSETAASNTNNNWIISNPVIGEFRRVVQSAPLPRSFQRQNSCPNSTTGRERSVSDTFNPMMDFRIRSPPVSAPSTVIQIENEDDSHNNRSATVNTRNRRRSSNSTFHNPPTDIFSQGTSSILPELNHLAIQLFPSRANFASSEITYNNSPETSNGAAASGSLSVPSNSDVPLNVPNGDNSPDGNTGSEDDADGSNNYTIPSFRLILQNRDALAQYIWQNFGEFPNLHGFNVSLLCLLVTTLLIVRFLFDNFASCCALFLSLMHYQDASRFMRCVSGSGDVYFTLSSVLIRNLMLIYVLGKWFVVSAAVFQDQITGLTNPNFFSVLYRVVTTELFVMDIALLLKIIVSKNPFMSKIYKRRVYQWLEYTSALYRYPIPFVQWACYFDGFISIVIYFTIKTIIGVSIMWSWFRTTIRLFRYSHLGTLPSSEETKNAEQCTICYGDFNSPIKLNCGHLFCSDCIRTWLDREVTCPICRATVSKEDNHYRNGSSIFPMHVF